MTEEEAIELLKYHSYTHENLDHPKIEKGYLGMLRPFKGELYEENFHELMAVLKTLKHYFTTDAIDRQVIASFWSICHLSRAWGLEEEGMLRSNSLISDEQIEQLATWTDCISYTVMSLLEGMEDEEAFEMYQFYLEDNSL